MNFWQPVTRRELIDAIATLHSIGGTLMSENDYRVNNSRQRPGQKRGSRKG